MTNSPSPRHRLAGVLLPFVETIDKEHLMGSSFVLLPPKAVEERALEAADAVMGLLSAAQDAAAMHALLTICWQTGHGCELRIVGTHSTQERLVVGPYTFEGDWSDIARRIIAWADALSHREANKPLPEPPS